MQICITLNKMFNEFAISSFTSKEGWISCNPCARDNRRATICINIKKRSMIVLINITFCNASVDYRTPSWDCPSHFAG